VLSAAFSALAAGFSVLTAGSESGSSTPTQPTANSDAVKAERTIRTNLDVYFILNYRTRIGAAVNAAGLRPAVDYVGEYGVPERLERIGTW